MVVVVPLDIVVVLPLYLLIAFDASGCQELRTVVNGKSWETNTPKTNIYMFVSMNTLIMRHLGHAHRGLARFSTSTPSSPLRSVVPLV